MVEREAMMGRKLWTEDGWTTVHVNGAQVTAADAWTAVMLTDGPTNPDRIVLDRLGMWGVLYETAHPAARVIVNGEQFVSSYEHEGRAGGMCYVLVDADGVGYPPGSYVGLQVRDEAQRLIVAKLHVYYL